MNKKILFTILLMCSFLSKAQNEQLLFNSSENDRVVIPNNEAYEFGSGSFTIEAVINASNIQTSYTPVILSKTGTDYSGGFSLFLLKEENYFFLKVIIDGILIFEPYGSGLSLNDNLCHHVAVRFDGNEVSLFRDGVMFDSEEVNISWNINNEADIYIGMEEATGSNSAFNGNISEVRFWDIARSNEEIQDNAMIELGESNREGLIGYWQLNETGNTQVLEDKSLVHNNGFLGMSDINESIDPNRVSGNCVANFVPNQLKFTAEEDDKVVVPANDAYELGAGSFTVEAFINASDNQFGAYPMILSKRGADDSSGLFFALSRYGDAYYPMVQINGLNFFLGEAYNIRLNDNQCHHVAVRRDSGIISIFIDGIMVDSTTITDNRQINNNADIFIGLDEYSNSGSGFNGNISEVRFWNVARTNEQIEHNSLMELQITDRQGLVGYWPLKEIGHQTVVVDNSNINNNGILGDSNYVETQDPTRVTGSCTRETLGVIEVSEINIEASVYPNPFSNRIRITGDVVGSSFIIYSLNGQLIKKGSLSEEKSIMLPSGLISGTYFLKIINKNGQRKVLKLIKN